MIPRTPPAAIGETLIVLGAMASFSYLVSTGNMASIESLWMFAGMLGVIVLFYFLLLLAHAIFTFMTGRPIMSGEDTFWWEKYEGKNPHKPKK